MSLAVDSTGEAAHDHEASHRKLARERARHLGAVGRARPRADDGDAGVRQCLDLSSYEQHLGRIVELGEQVRIAGLRPGKRANDVHVHEPSSDGDL